MLPGFRLRRKLRLQGTSLPYIPIRDLKGNASGHPNSNLRFRMHDRDRDIAELAEAAPTIRFHMVAGWSDQRTVRSR